jgi:HPt (histidine-containing phosphotransfer) domain-containing protein
MHKFAMGKYKSLVIAISTFVLLIASVMSLNFIISIQLAYDAVGISIAGRQRMLSQRLFKDLLNLQREAESGGNVLILENQVVEISRLFDSSLHAFIKGGYTKGDHNLEVKLEKVNSQVGLRSLEEALILWEPFKRLIDIMSSEEPNIAWMTALTEAIDYDRSHNVELAGHLNNLTTILQSEGQHANAVVVGRQQMLSQRLAKELLELKEGVNSGDVLNKLFENLSTTVIQFDTILTALQKGGTMTDVNDASVNLVPITSPKGLDVLAATTQLWMSYKPLLASLLSEARDTRWREHLAESIAYGRDNNLSLLIMMDDLAKELERLALEKATRLRYLQAGAIALAFLFFFVTLLRFVKRLRESDAIAEKARKDTENILKTVQEGLFLLDDRSTIGSQFSTATKSIFGKEHLEGLTFHNLLGDVITERDMQLTDDYIELLFGGRVNENLIADINPLNQVEINLEQEGSFQTKYLSFNFNRVYLDGETSSVLVTVNDISDKIKLQNEIEDLKEKSQDQLNMLTNLLHIDKAILENFLNDTDAGLSSINDIFRQSQNSSSDYHKKLDQIFRIIHKLKGDAAALNLESFEFRAHEFEDMLMTLREQSAISGNDFLPLTVKLNEFIIHHSTVRSLVERFYKMQSIEDSDMNASKSTQDWSALEQLANRIAAEHGKQIEFYAQGLDANSIPHKYHKTVWDIAVQLVRNSVVHGIETPYQRLNAQKSDAGNLELSFHHNSEGYEFTVRDDGGGIDAEMLRAKALKQGSWRKDDVASWDEARLLSLIFEPGFSTVSEVTKDAGRGVGMDIIKEIVESIQGDLKLDTVPGQYCEFKIKLPE